MLLTTVGPYPVSMVGMPGEKVSNMSPPTLALAACAVWLIGLVLLLRGPVSRWLARPAVWRGVVTANGLAMTAFLWHLTAMFAATAATLAIGIPQPAVGTGDLVAAASTVDRRAAGADRRAGAGVPAGRPAAAGVGDRVHAVRGRGRRDGAVHGRCARVLGGRIRRPAGRPHRDLLVVPVSPLLAALLLVAGAGLLRLTRRPA